jgi:hypothetical protein
MRTRMFIFIALIAAGLPLGGCDSTSQQRIAAIQKTVGELEKRSAQLDAAVSGLQVFMADAKGMLADPNVTGEASGKLAELIEKTQAQITEQLATKAKIDAVLAALQQKLQQVDAGGQVDVSDELALLANGLSAAGTQISGETGKWLSLGGAILAFIAGLVPGLLKARAVGTSLAQAKTALQDVVQAGENFKDLAEEKPAESALVLFKQAQAAVQDKRPATKELVALARARV